ncbi:hypothetical protein [Streptomyces sp. C8S0]|uniref:hypothetical protein n=1 Tax=Streptomyces sp. C8S0 TaxID=2585716 RepID=UPI00125E93B0|nr:hypothetical protein [Streptomyces sp. C8S0]
MDTVQPGGCGPVIAEEGQPWLSWLVPPGTVRAWENQYGACLSAPMAIDFPPMHHERPPGPYWLRPFRTHVRVGPRLLHDALNAVKPEQTPYEALSHLLSFYRGQPQPSP